MTDVTRILNAIEKGDLHAVDRLFPLVYQELRQLAAQQMSKELPGQTLQATALVHEAYLRLVGGEDQNWSGRYHFFCAAAEAMRGILIEIIRPDMVVILGPFPMAGILAAARITPLTLLLTHFQAFLAPEPIDPLEIDKPALFTELDGDATVIACIQTLIFKI